MTVSRPVAPSVAAEIGQRLAAAADANKREWWERYLKGAIAFRGTPMAVIRKAVHDVWLERGLARLPLEQQLDIAMAQFAQGPAEDKLAGTLILGELVAEELQLEHVDRLAEPFEAGHIFDWSTCDWYCVKALGPFVGSGDRRRRAEAIAAWKATPSLWQRRAAAVTFVNHAPHARSFFDGFTDLLLDVCASNLQDAARFSQTSVGWLLRELSKAEPTRVREFLDRYHPLMSREALKSASSKLDSARDVDVRAPVR